MIKIIFIKTKMYKYKFGKNWHASLAVAVNFGLRTGLNLFTYFRGGHARFQARPMLLPLCVLHTTGLYAR